MQAKRWIAVPNDNPDAYYIEDSQAAMEYALMSGKKIAYFRIELTPDNEPTVRATPVVAL